MADATQNKAFAESMMGQWPLDEAIDWITSNLTPEDVFEVDALEEWAKDAGYKTEEEWREQTKENG